jgi:hypothetical protein
MRRLAVLLLVLTFAACAKDETPQATASPTVTFAPDVAEQSVLRVDDIGSTFERESTAEPSTVQVGGKVGPANVKGAEQEMTIAFKQKDDSGYITNSVFLLESVDLARAVMEAHRQATVEKWTQERKDGGGATFRSTGEVDDIPSLGDETFTAAISSEVRTGDGVATKRKIEYVVYRIDRLLSFVIAQDAQVSTFARRQEQKVARLTT